MEQPNKIDELLRQRLYDTEVAPPAFVWPNVERALRKRKRRLLFWIFTGVALSSLGAAWAWQNHFNATIAGRTQPARETPREHPTTAGTAAGSDHPAEANPAELTTPPPTGPSGSGTATQG